MTEKYDRNLHSVFLLQYHLILVIKYRHKVIDNQINERLKEIFDCIAKSYQITMIEFNHDQDHIHILFKATPGTNLLKFINAYKSASSRLIKKEFKEKIREYFWSGSYFLATTGEVSIEILKKYVENQGNEDHRVKKIYKKRCK